MKDQIEINWLKIEKHFPESSDLTLQVLKGHLLVEELLREIFILLLSCPEALNGNRGTSFECHQIICLVQAMTKHSTLEPWVWDAAKRLNGIRNDLAHNLEPRSVENKVESLIKFVIHENIEAQPLLDRFRARDVREFKVVILMMCASLVSLKINVAAGSTATAA